MMHRREGFAEPVKLESFADWLRPAAFSRLVIAMATVHSRTKRKAFERTKEVAVRLPRESVSPL